MNAQLAILGSGVYLPPAYRVRDVVTRAGGDPSNFKGWENVCMAGADDHPSTMGAKALQRALGDAGVDPAERKSSSCRG